VVLMADKESESGLGEAPREDSGLVSVNGNDGAGLSRTDATTNPNSLRDSFREETRGEGLRAKAESFTSQGQFTRARTFRPPSAGPHVPLPRPPPGPPPPSAYQSPLPMPPRGPAPPPGPSPPFLPPPPAVPPPRTLPPPPLEPPPVGMAMRAGPEGALGTFPNAACFFVSSMGVIQDATTEALRLTGQPLPRIKGAPLEMVLSAQDGSDRFSWRSLQNLASNPKTAWPVTVRSLLTPASGTMQAVTVLLDVHRASQGIAALVLPMDGDAWVGHCLMESDTVSMALLRLTPQLTIEAASESFAAIVGAPFMAVRHRALSDLADPSHAPAVSRAMALRTATPMRFPVSPRLFKDGAGSGDPGSAAASRSSSGRHGGGSHAANGTSRSDAGADDLLRELSAMTLKDGSGIDTAPNMLRYVEVTVMWGATSHLALVRDVTGQRQVELEHKWMTTLLSLLPSVWWVFDSDLNVRAVSRSVRDVLGWDPDELIGIPGVKLVHPEDMPTILREVQSTAERVSAERPAGFVRAQKMVFEYRRATRDDRWVWLECHGITAQVGSETLHFVVDVDITSRHNLMAELEASRKATGELVSLVAMQRNHGPRDPLVEAHSLVEELAPTLGSLRLEPGPQVSAGPDGWGATVPAQDPRLPRRSPQTWQAVNLLHLAVRTMEAVGVGSLDAARSLLRSWADQGPR